MDNESLRNLPERELRKKIVEKYGAGEEFGEDYTTSKTGKNVSELVHKGDPYSEEYMRRAIEFESY